MVKIANDIFVHQFYFSAICILEKKKRSAAALTLSAASSTLEETRRGGEGPYLILVTISEFCKTLKHGPVYFG